MPVNRSISELLVHDFISCIALKKAVRAYQDMYSPGMYKQLMSVPHYPLNEDASLARTINILQACRRRIQAKKVPIEKRTRIKSEQVATHNIKSKIEGWHPRSSVTVEFGKPAIRKGGGHIYVTASHMWAYKVKPVFYEEPHDNPLDEYQIILRAEEFNTRIRNLRAFNVDIANTRLGTVQTRWIGMVEMKEYTYFTDPLKTIAGMTDRAKELIARIAADDLTKGE